MSGQLCEVFPWVNLEREGRAYCCEHGCSRVGYQTRIRAIGPFHSCVSNAIFAHNICIWAEIVSHHTIFISSSLLFSFFFLSRISNHF